MAPCTSPTNPLQYKALRRKGAAAVQTPDDSFEQDFEDRFQKVLSSEASPLPVRPNLHAATVAAVIFGIDGDILWADPAFDRWIGHDAIDQDVCDSVRVSAKARLVLSEDQNGCPAMLCYAPASKARQWPLQYRERAGTAQTKWSVAVGAISFAHMSDEVVFATRALGFSNLEARVSAALVATGSVRQAAKYARVTYQTGRKAISDSMTKLGVSRQAALVHRLSKLATNAAPPRAAAIALLTDLFALRAKDARLAFLLCEGRSRDDAAAIEGISRSVAKDRYKRIFQRLGVRSAAEIPRLVMEAFAAAMLVGPAPPLANPQPRRRVPLTFVQRPKGGLIAVSDFGPASGKPVLILHSSLSTRHPFQRVVEALQGAGFRPLSIDRPGFGLTDDIDCRPRDDPFSVGADDVLHMCDHLGLERISLLTRGGSFAALAVARRHPDLIDRAILINPDMLQSQCSQRKGYLGTVRRAFDRFPSAIEKVARWSAAQLTPERTQTMIRMALKDTPVDMSSFQKRDVMDDYARSIMAFASGILSGFIREQRGYATLEDVDGLAGGANWTILVGEQDPIHDVSEALEYWKTKLPGVTITHVPGANRYISLSHPNAVLEALG